MKAAPTAPPPGVNEARDLIRSRGERLTTPRARVLAVLLGADHALSHHEVEAMLRRASAVDRVTVYRVLDWLVDCGLAHRIAGEDRAWRFRATPRRDSAPHAHFTCTQCGRTVCLESVTVPRRIAMPAGFHPEVMELTVRGRCARCGGAARPAPRG